MKIILTIILSSSFDHPHIIAGQGTIGLEIVEQVPDIDAVIVPTGGGGLIAGVALAVKTLNPNVQIIVSVIVLQITVVLYTLILLTGSRIGTLCWFLQSTTRR